MLIQEKQVYSPSYWRAHRGYLKIFIERLSAVQLGEKSVPSFIYSPEHVAEFALICSTRNTKLKKKSLNAHIKWIFRWFDDAIFPIFPSINIFYIKVTQHEEKTKVLPFLGEKNSKTGLSLLAYSYFTQQKHGLFTVVFCLNVLNITSIQNCNRKQACVAILFTLCYL